MATFRYLFLALAAALAAYFGAQQTDTTQGGAYSEPVQAKVVRVADGDTITVLIGGKEERVRYIGVDTPEYARDGRKEECFAEEATVANERMVAGKTVTLVSGKEDRDKYQRLLRYVYVDDVFVNQELVANGYADTLFIPPNTTYKKDFTKLKNSAKEEGLGLWGACK